MKYKIEINGSGTVAEILNALELVKQSLTEMQDSELPATWEDKTLSTEVSIETVEKTEDAYEDWLNEGYSKIPVATATNKLLYLTNPKRNNGHVTDADLLQHYHARTLGSLLRKLDSIAFTVGYRDWNP